MVRAELGVRVEDTARQGGIVFFRRMSKTGPTCLAGSEIEEEEDAARQGCIVFFRRMSMTGCTCLAASEVEEEEDASTKGALFFWKTMIVTTRALSRCSLSSSIDVGTIFRADTLFDSITGTVRRFFADKNFHATFPQQVSIRDSTQFLGSVLMIEYEKSPSTQEGIIVHQLLASFVGKFMLKSSLTEWATGYV